jgi:hypothetical protein
LKPAIDSSNNFVSYNHGKTWTFLTPIPTGYVESVVQLGQKSLLAIGPNGTSISNDLAKTWKKIDNYPFHALSGHNASVWAVGAKGMIGKWVE